MGIGSGIKRLSWRDHFQKGVTSNVTDSLKVNFTLLMDSIHYLRMVLVLKAI